MKTKPSERIRAGYVPVEIRWWVVGDPQTLHRTTHWCVHRQEAFELLQWAAGDRTEAFQGDTFVLTPGMRVLTAERLDELSA